MKNICILLIDFLIFVEKSLPTRQVRVLGLSGTRENCV